jgi:hypothetical protein
MKIFLILYFHRSWLGLSQQTVSCYNPFNLQWLFVIYEQLNTSTVLGILSKNGNADPTIIEQHVLNKTISTYQDESQAKDDNQYGWPSFILQEGLNTSSPAAALPSASSSTRSPTKSSSTAVTSLSAFSDKERASLGMPRTSLTAEDIPGQRRHGTQIKQYEEEKGQEREQGIEIWTEWSQEGGDKAKVTEWGYDTGQKILEVTLPKSVLPAKEIPKSTEQQENSGNEEGRLPISKTTESSLLSSTDGTPVNKIAAETPLYDIGPMSNIPRGNILFQPDVGRSQLNTHSQPEVAKLMEDYWARRKGQAMPNITVATSLISEENPKENRLSGQNRTHGADSRGAVAAPEIKGDGRSSLKEKETPDLPHDIFLSNQPPVSTR